MYFAPEGYRCVCNKNALYVQPTKEMTATFYCDQCMPKGTAVMTIQWRGTCPPYKSYPPQKGS